METWKKLLRFQFLKDHGAFGWNWLYLIQHPCTIPVEAYYRVKWFIQRGKRGWSDSDGWSIFDYISEWMPDALRRLKDSHGTPISMYPENMTMEDISHTTDEEGEEAHKRWEKTLEDMALGFEAVKLLDDELPLPSTDRWKELRAQRDKGMALFVEHFESL